MPKRPEQYLDGSGVPYAPYHVTELGMKLPPVREDNAALQYYFHEEFDLGGCWWCGAKGRMELHHLLWRGGRSHERTLFAMLCPGCHREHANERDLPRMLYLKWKFDRPHTNWLLISFRHDRRLPDELDPIT